MSAFYAAIVTINFITGLSILISGLKKEYRHFQSFAILSFMCIAYTLANWNFHLSEDLDEAIFYSKLQLTCLFTALPLFVYTFAKWCAVKGASLISAGIGFAVLMVIIFNFSSETSLRYGPDASLIYYSSSYWGDFITVSGDSSPVFIAFQSVFVIAGILGFWFGVRLFIRESKLVGSMVLLTIAGQMFVTWIGFQIDTNNLAMIYMGNVPFTILSVFMMFRLAHSLKLTRIDVSTEREKLNDLKHDFVELAKGVSDPHSNLFFEKMLKTIYSFSGSKVIFIGLIDETQTHLKSTLFLENGEVGENFEYALRGTPCDKVIDNNVCIYPKDVTTLFPNDQLLVDMDISSYLGWPLMNEQGKAFGLLVLLNTDTFSPSKEFEHILGIFASRASAELQRQVAEEQLEKMAYFDYATRLPNRAKLLKYLEELPAKLNENAHIAIFLVDIDHFNFINRKYGKDIADALIREVGGRLMNYASADLFIAREGGDEFVIVMNASMANIHGKVEVHWEAIKSIFEAPFTIGKRIINISCSAGVVTLSSSNLLKLDAISHAGIALQQAKEKGRKQCVRFEEGLANKLDYDRTLITKLQKAISDESIFLVYQAKQDSLGKVIGAEALARWEDPEDGFISPEIFIPLAESNGLIGELTSHVARTVARDITAMSQKGLLVPKISINISTSDLNNPRFVETLLNNVEKQGAKPTQIELEITETGIIESFDFAVVQLGKLKDKGFTIALDDFGTGYSSLSYLDRLPLDVLKIDKSFISKIHTMKGKAMVESIISIANNMDFDIVAEGTENKCEVDELVAMGCKSFQGYFFSKPLELNGFMKYFTACANKV